MSRMSELAAEIDNLLEEGCPPDIIAETLGVEPMMVLLYVEGKHSVRKPSAKPSILDFDDDIPY